MESSQRIRQITKLGVSSALHYSGILSRLRAKFMQGGAVILMYHRILPEADARFDYAPNGMVVTQKVFAAHMRFLSHSYQTITIAELHEHLNADAVPTRPLAVVTFDDGWLDNYQNAWPILQRYHVPATIFIATNFIDGGNWYWLERLKFVLAHAHKMLATGKLQGPRRSRLVDGLAALDLLDLAEGYDTKLGHTLARVAQHTQKFEEHDRSEFMAQIDEISELSDLPGSRYFMTWDEVKKLANDGFYIGAHTRSHVDLTTITKHEVKEELGSCKSRLESELQHPIEHFAYPYGKNNDSVRTQTENAGFKSSCSTVSGLVNKGSDPHLLNRINLHTAVSPTRAMFAYRLLDL